MHSSKDILFGQYHCWSLNHILFIQVTECKANKLGPYMNSWSTETEQKMCCTLKVQAELHQNFFLNPISLSWSVSQFILFMESFQESFKSFLDLNFLLYT